MKAVLLTDAEDSTKVLLVFGEGGAVKAMRITNKNYTEVYAAGGDHMHDVEETPEQIAELLEGK